MSDRREVNVGRLEHSWIPFYRELAGKLVNDGWRGRQRELVGVFKGILDRLRSEAVPVPRVETFLGEHVDPFTIFAVIARNVTPENYRKTVRAYKMAFKLRSELPEKPEIPWVDNRRVGFFGRYSDVATESVKLWDAFEMVYQMNSFEQIDKRTRLIELIDKCIEIDEVGIAKLTGGFYWINPQHFLRNDTVSAVGGQELGTRAVDGASYLECLERTDALTSTPFPEVNIAVWEGREIELVSTDDESDRLNVWIVRGGSSGASVNYQLENGIAGIGFNLGDVDLSSVLDGEAIREAYASRNPNASSGSVSANASSVGNFVRDLKICDYVLMPDGDGNRIHFGKVISDPYYVPNGPWENRRDIEWSSRTLRRSDLPSLPTRTRTVVRATDSVKNEFLSWLKDLDTNEFQMPEDSWVLFHLEVRKRLIEEEMWKPEMREVFGSLVMQVVGAAGEINENMADMWTPDPYSFYLAFNTASEDRDRDAGYDKVRELFEITVPTPDRGYYARRYGVHYWVEMRLEEAGVDFLWDFFQFLCGADPVDDSDDEAEFVRRFDTVLTHDVPGMASATLSQWLYWIDPTKYLLPRRIHASELGLAAHLGLTEPIEDGAKYVEALKVVHSFARSRHLTMLDINRESTTREMLGLDGSADTIRETYGVTAMLREGVFLEETEIKRVVRILRSKKNLILQGPPGVGKTFIARKLAYVLMESKAEKRITSVQFHQSYAYEDFVGGFRPDVRGGQMVFERQDGPFLKVCKTGAQQSRKQIYVVLIDEINRGNLSRVFRGVVDADRSG